MAANKIKRKKTFQNNAGFSYLVIVLVTIAVILILAFQDSYARTGTPTFRSEAVTHSNTNSTRGLSLIKNLTGLFK